jgi:adenine-specific DNA methylase
MSSRLIEKWLPIAALGVEAVRERTPMTPFPAPNRLHVWWARRPLIASRAAVLASLLPADVTPQDFNRAIGIHGDPVSARTRISLAKKTGENLGLNPYGYARAFQHRPTSDAAKLLPELNSLAVLDATAGGGAIPFEAMRLGAATFANDLNPVASLLLKATAEFPRQFGMKVRGQFDELAERFLSKQEDKLATVYPREPEGVRVDGYLWARTISCPYCVGEIPLAPNWRIGPEGDGIRLNLHCADGPGDHRRKCEFELVSEAEGQSAATVAGGDAICPYPDCGRSIAGDEIKRQARAGELGDRLFAISYKRHLPKDPSIGRKRDSWERGFRVPDTNDDNLDAIKHLFEQRREKWEAFDLIPTERIWSNGKGSRVNDPSQYGNERFSDFFNARQLFVHCSAVETFRDLLEEDGGASGISSVQRAAYCYLAIAIDKTLDYNSRTSAWHAGRQVIEHTFRDHAFLIKWSYAEMPLAVVGDGYKWALRETSKCIKELVELICKRETEQLFSDQSDVGTINITRGSGSNLDHLASASIDAIVMDPPYGANVMYAELSDFFYVWLKRTAGLVVPELFTDRLTDKDSEAVANRSHFVGQPGASRLADVDYQHKMAAIFLECRRVLKPDGIMTVMFTHKDTGAWDALAMSLMEAGFVITASWPVNTEAAGSLHIKDKAAANSTIFLVCRPRAEKQGEIAYWEDVEPEVAAAVRDRVADFQASGVQGVDLYLASFGPALEALSRHWPLTRGTPAPEPKRNRKSQKDLFIDFDPYAVRPEDALNSARREVKAWRLKQLASLKARADMDAATAFYVLAWDAFRAPAFPYDEALRLSRAVGVDLEEQVVGRLGEKKGSELRLWDSATRIAKGAIGPADGSRGMIDALHHAAHAFRTRGIEAAREMLEKAGIAQDEEFKVALEAILEVLPPSKTFSGLDADKAVRPAADDFDALEKLRRIAYAGEIDEPKQLELYRDLLAA